MSTKHTQPLTFSTRTAWRDWLERNHDQEAEAWLVIRKKHAPRDGIGLEEAVLEALCFGWIDSQLQRRDDVSYALRFSPRQPESVWSLKNTQRVEKLIAGGQMTAAGLEKVRQGKASGQWDAARRRAKTDKIPSDLDHALRRVPGSLEAFRGLPPSRRQQLVYWLESAKRQETRERRIKAILLEIGH